MGHAWSVLCPKEERAGMVEALRTIDGLAECEFAVFDSLLIAQKSRAAFHS